jgi:hypothetical protein
LPGKLDNFENDTFINYPLGSWPLKILFNCYHHVFFYSFSFLWSS